MAIATGQQAKASEVLALAFNSKLKAESRLGDAASGDVAYSGYGFKPKALIIFATTTIWVSWGFGDVNLAEMCMYKEATHWESSSTSIIILEDDAGANGQTAVLKTLDTDGFTLTWTKLAAGSAAINFMVLALY